MRCFVGILLPEATRVALAAAGDAIRAADPRWRAEKWVAAENLHITVAFLGDLPAEMIAPLSAAVRDGLAPAHVFELPFAGLRPVPNARRASMLWAAYADPEGACAALAAATAQAVARFGVAVERRMFAAHVTLVRARHPQRVGEQALSALEAARPRVPALVSVPSAMLFSSTLARTGPRYETLRSWDFRA